MEGCSIIGRMEEIMVQPMDSREMAACVDILLENPLWGHYGMTGKIAGQMLQAALTAGTSILTARQDAQTVGFVWYMSNGAWGRSGYIRLIGVAPQFQGKGIGERLMAEAEARMGESVNDVFLLVSDFNTRAARFYQRLGYQQVGAIPDYVVSGITELIFHKRLAGREVLSYPG